MNATPSLRRFFFCAACLALLAGCSSQSASSLRPDGTLAACPTKPNCVSSIDTDAKHQIAAFRIQGDPAAAWAALKDELAKQPRTEILADRDNYLHVVVTTRLMRYKDDAEFVLLADRNEIAVRSSSRVGYSDMGVNRKRIEALRAALLASGVVR